MYKSKLPLKGNCLCPASGTDKTENSTGKWTSEWFLTKVGLGYKEFCLTIPKLLCWDDGTSSYFVELLLREQKKSFWSWALLGAIG